MEAIGHASLMMLKGLGWFLGLWIVYWFMWFMVFGTILLALGPRLIRPFRGALKRGKKIEFTLDFWVIFWYGFMTTIIHSIIYLLFFR